MRQEVHFTGIGDNAPSAVSHVVVTVDAELVGAVSRVKTGQIGEDTRAAI